MTMTAIGRTPQCAGSALGGTRLDEPHLTSPRNPEASCWTAPSVDDRIHELDALALELLNGLFDVVARQIELVLPFCRLRITARMNRELRRRHESQPTIARVGTGKLQNVAEEGRRGLGVMRENRDDRRRDHPTSIGIVAAERSLTEDIDATRIPTAAAASSRTHWALAPGRTLAPGQPGVASAVEPFLQADSDGVALLLADCLADVGLHGQLVGAVTQRHE